MTIAQAKSNGDKVPRPTSRMMFVSCNCQPVSQSVPRTNKHHPRPGPWSATDQPTARTDSNKQTVSTESNQVCTSAPRHSRMIDLRCVCMDCSPLFMAKHGRLEPVVEHVLAGDVLLAFIGRSINQSLELASRPLPRMLAVLSAFHFGGSQKVSARAVNSSKFAARGHWDGPCAFVWLPGGGEQYYELRIVGSFLRVVCSAENGCTRAKTVLTDRGSVAHQTPSERVVHYRPVDLVPRPPSLRMHACVCYLI